MSKNDRSQINTIYYIVLGVVVLLVLIRLPVFKLFFWWIIPLGLALGLGYLIFIGIQALRQRMRQQAFEKTTAGRIYRKIETCEALYHKNEEEINDIRTNIRELEHKVGRVSDISTHHQQESRELLAGFKSELELRRAKAGFYQRCIHKLKNLLHNVQLAGELEEKKKKLRLLKENNYEEMARLEEIKSDLEMDTVYLDTIDELSLRMIESSTVDDAEHLRLELEEMTRELDEL